MYAPLIHIDFSQKSLIFELYGPTSPNFDKQIYLGHEESHIYISYPSKNSRLSSYTRQIFVQRVYYVHRQEWGENTPNYVAKSEALSATCGCAEVLATLRLDNFCS